MTNQQDLDTLKRMVHDARQLACGGAHANSADPFLPPEMLMAIIEAAMHLNRAVAVLENAPPFIVFEGAAGTLAPFPDAPLTSLTQTPPPE